MPRTGPGHPIRTIANAIALSTALLIAASASSARAHVNRTVGPYTILVILVEEPTYEDNHAGFEFWVRRDGFPITGLDQTIRAVATGHGDKLDLAIPPIDGSGFYVIDHTADGQAFDPRGGGAWTLFLSGSIQGTPVDTSFPVTFPSYPRVGVPMTPSTASGVGASSASGGWPAWLIGLGATGLLGAVAGLMMSRRRRVRGA